MKQDDGYTRYTVRIPTPLYERVKIAAGEKSVNAEIVATLEDKYTIFSYEKEVREYLRNSQFNDSDERELLEMIPIALSKLKNDKSRRRFLTDILRGIELPPPTDKD